MIYKEQEAERIARTLNNSERKYEENPFERFHFVVQESGPGFARVAVLDEEKNFIEYWEE